MIAAMIVPRPSPNRHLHCVGWLAGVAEARQSQREIGSELNTAAGFALAEAGQRGTLLRVPHADWAIRLKRRGYLP